MIDVFPIPPIRNKLRAWLAGSTSAKTALNMSLISARPVNVFASSSNAVYASGGLPEESAARRGWVIPRHVRRSFLPRAKVTHAEVGFQHAQDFQRVAGLEEANGLQQVAVVVDVPFLVELEIAPNDLVEPLTGVRTLLFYQVVNSRSYFL